jgi:hypothetical protein
VDFIDFIEDPGNADVLMTHKYDGRDRYIHGRCVRCGVEMALTDEALEKMEAFPHEPWCSTIEVGTE